MHEFYQDSRGVDELLHDSSGVNLVCNATANSNSNTINDYTATGTATTTTAADTIIP